MTTHDPLTPLLELDPDLGRLLSDGRSREAHAELGVRLSHVRRGPWDAAPLAAAHPENIGLLVVDGVLAREVLIADTVSAELLGAGDVVRPWSDDDELRLLATTCAGPCSPMCGWPCSTAASPPASGVSPRSTRC
jgi:hypothetical protein